MFLQSGADVVGVDGAYGYWPYYDSSVDPYFIRRLIPEEYFGLNSPSWVLREQGPPYF